MRNKSANRNAQIRGLVCVIVVYTCQNRFSRDKVSFFVGLFDIQTRLTSVRSGQQVHGSVRANAQTDMCFFCLYSFKASS